MTKHVVIGLPEVVKPISQYIKLSDIDIPEDRARDLDMDWAQALASMIAAQGLINPITVRMVDGRPRLVAGLHRYTGIGLSGKPFLRGFLTPLLMMMRALKR
ncbi:hypothetical protein DEA98_06755 [Brucella pseudogrignonensis]|nr:hypothetical protein [Brucella pseudogrignonensis]